jgi:hypothetical protein
MYADPIKGLNAFGAQLSFAPTEGVSAYLNFMDGSVSGTIVDLTVSNLLINQTRFKRC